MSTFGKDHLTKLGKWGREGGCWWGKDQVKQRQRREHDSNLQNCSKQHLICEKQLKIRDHSDLNLTSWGKDRLFTFLIPSLLMKEHHIKHWTWSSLTEWTMQGEAFVYRWTVDCSYERLREVDQLWNLNWISRPFALFIRWTRKQAGCYFLAPTEMCEKPKSRTSKIPVWLLKHKFSKSIFYQIVKHCSSSLRHLDRIETCREHNMEASRFTKTSKNVIWMPQSDAML